MHARTRTPCQMLPTKYARVSDQKKKKVRKSPKPCTKAVSRECTDTAKEHSFSHERSPNWKKEKILLVPILTKWGCVLNTVSHSIWGWLDWAKKISWKFQMWENTKIQLFQESWPDRDKSLPVIFLGACIIFVSTFFVTTLYFLKVRKRKLGFPSDTPLTIIRWFSFWVLE